MDFSIDRIRDQGSGSAGIGERMGSGFGMLVAWIAPPTTSSDHDSPRLERLPRTESMPSAKSRTRRQMQMGKASSYGGRPRNRCCYDSNVCASADARQTLKPQHQIALYDPGVGNTATTRNCGGAASGVQFSRRRGGNRLSRSPCACCWASASARPGPTCGAYAGSRAQSPAPRPTCRVSRGAFPAVRSPPCYRWACSSGSSALVSDAVQLYKHHTIRT